MIAHATVVVKQRDIARTHRGLNKIEMTQRQSEARKVINIDEVIRHQVQIKDDSAVIVRVLHEQVRVGI